MSIRRDVTNFSVTAEGFASFRFIDVYGFQGELTESKRLGHVKFGVDGGVVQLNVDMARQLLPFLQNFVETGTILGDAFASEQRCSMVGTVLARNPDELAQLLLSARASSLVEALAEEQNSLTRAPTRKRAKNTTPSVAADGRSERRLDRMTCGGSKCLRRQPGDDTCECASPESSEL